MIIYCLLPSFKYTKRGINDFTGYEVLNTFTFRITRNADLSIHEEGAEDLLIEIERFLKERKSGSAVRLEVDGRHAAYEDMWYILSISQMT